MGATHKKWTDELEDGYLDAYYVARKRGIGKMQSKVEAQNAAIPKEQRYAESSLKSRMVMSQYVLDELDTIDELIFQDKPWYNSRSAKKVEAKMAPVPVPVGNSGETMLLESAPASNQQELAYHFLRSPAMILAEYDQALMAKITQGLRGYILQELEIGFNQMLDYFTDPELPEGATVPKTLAELRKRKKIILVGMTDAQFAITRRHFPTARLTHIQANHVGSRLAGAAQGADAVIIMTGFVSHDSQEIAKKYAPGKVHLCPGMMAKATELLSQMLELAPVK